MAQLDEYPSETIELEDAVALVVEHAEEEGNVVASAEEFIECSEEAIVFPDHVQVEGDLELEHDEYDGKTVIFAKGLTATGAIIDSGGEDCTVVVLGDLVAKHLVCTTNWLVTGDIHISGTAVGYGTELYLMEADKGGESDVLLSSGYGIDYIKGETHLKEPADPAAVLHADCVEDGCINLKGIVNRLKADLGILP